MTAERLRELLHYDPETGVFTWRVYRGVVWPGCVAGCSSAIKGRYRMIGVDQERLLAHRLAFLWMTGEWPLHKVDHVNGNGQDNRWANLRQATDRDNTRNRHSHPLNTSGYIGVTRDNQTRSRKKWRASIRNNAGKYQNLGRYMTAREAATVRDEAARRLHGEFATLNNL